MDHQIHGPVGGSKKGAVASEKGAGPWAQKGRVHVQKETRRKPPRGGGLPTGRGDAVHEWSVPVPWRGSLEGRSVRVPSRAGCRRVARRGVVSRVKTEFRPIRRPTSASEAKEEGATLEAIRAIQ